MTRRTAVPDLAAEKFELPGWSAERRISPAPVMVRTLLDIDPGPDVTRTVTGSPEDAEGGEMAKGASPKVLSAIGVKDPSDCLAWVTINVLLAGVAALHG